MHPYLIMRKAVVQLVVVVVMKDLINVGEKVGVKDGLEGGSIEGEYRSIDGEIPTPGLDLGILCVNRMRSLSWGATKKECPESGNNSAVLFLK